MGFATAWQLSAVAAFWPIAGQKGASAFLPREAVQPAIQRLKRRSEFLRIAGARRKSVTPGLILQALHRVTDGDRPGTVDTIGIGFTVSRRVGNAVARNRARRRLKAAAEQIFPIHAVAGIDFVVIGRAATIKRPFAALLSDLETALKRLQAYRDG
jgi:ribonuclease P protein component